MKRKISGILVSIFLVGTLSYCGNEDSTRGGEAGLTGADKQAAELRLKVCAGDGYTTLNFGPGEEAAIQTAINSLSANTKLVLAAGTYSFNNTISIDSVDGIIIEGAGKDKTILDFESASTGNGLEVYTQDRFCVQNLTVQNSAKDAVRIDGSNDVGIVGVKVTWTNGPDSGNGAYGLYPVKSTNVLMEDCEAYNASDAGIYVGQTVRTIVRNNIAKQNVAGIEIENTRYADVYGNLAEDNTGGLVVFDLPGNEVKGTDVRIHHNEIVENNRANFAPGGTVQQIPAGTGTFVLASRRVEIDNNTYRNNNTGDVAILSGLVIEDDVPGGAWLPLNNYKTQNIYVHDNSFSGSGTNPDDGLAGDGSTVVRELAYLISNLYGPAFLDSDVDNILYDGIDDNLLNPAEGYQNDHDICLMNNGNATFADLEIAGQGATPDTSIVTRPDAPFKPFDCELFTGEDDTDSLAELVEPDFSLSGAD